MKNCILLTTLASCMCLLTSLISADVVLDFSHDAATDAFFTSNPTAKAAVEKAAADINAVLNSTLTPIAAADYNITGSAGGALGTTVTIDTSLTYLNPSTGATETYSPTGLATNEYRVFVGMRELTGTTLGEGGLGGAGTNVNANSFDGFSTLGAALDDAEAQANAVFGRGGPNVSTINGSIGGENYSINFGPTVGNLWFDNDTNNNTATDSAAELDAFWHFDANTPVASGKTDFYSIALHEILHTVGIGSADTWDNNVSGTDWTGANAIALHGTGSGLIAADGSHIAFGVMSNRLSDGLVQEVVMDPNIGTGTRKELTSLDVAFLQDIGWNISAVPEPGSLSLLALLTITATMCRRRRRSHK